MVKHAKEAPQDKHPELPYTAVVDQPRLMKGGEMPTVFGVLGMTKMDAPSRSLGGLVANPKPSAKAPETKKDKALRVATDRNIAGSPSKTHISGMHYGQVPYPGAFMAHEGHKL